MLAILERRAVRIPLYLLLGTIAFSLAMVLTFPDDRVKQILIVQAEKALGHKYDVTINDLDLWWLTGVELHQVELRERWTEQQLEKAASEAKEGVPPKMPLSVSIPRVAGRLAPISSLVNLALVVEFAVDFDEGGSVTGSYKQSSTKRGVQITFNDLDMNKSGVLASVTGIPGFGELKGDVELELDPKRPMIIGGKIELLGKKLTIGPGLVETDKIPSMVYLEVPQTNFGNLLIQAKVEQPKGQSPKLVFEKFESVGRDIHMQLWGDVVMASNPKSSRSNLETRLKFEESYITENSLRPLLNIKHLRDGKGPDNWYGFSLYGPVGNVRFKGSVTASRGPGKTSANGADAADGADTEESPTTTKTKVKPPKISPKAFNPKANEEPPAAEEEVEVIEESEPQRDEIIEEEVNEAP